MTQPYSTSGPRPGALRAFRDSFSGLGLLIGALLLAASLTPSLIPRAPALQGVLAGTCMAIGYLAGVVLEWLWRFLGLPLPRAQTVRIANWIAAAAAAAVVVSYLWRAAGWQNSIRVLMDMPPVTSSEPLLVGAVTGVVFLVLLLLGRGFVKVVDIAEHRAARIMPVRAARAIGLAIAVVLFTLLIDGVLIRSFLDFSDRSFAALDALIEPDTAPPPDGPGSPQSLLSWEGLGRAGRNFVAGGPTRAEIAAFTGRPALAPIRVYAGLNTAETVEDRAQLALRELIRTGAFDRSVLVVVTPTGTGWMDPEATDTLEYLHGGDTALVAQQYSYLTSWISLLVEPGYAQETGRALFRAIYGYWTTLPKDARPRLYLHGLSLGAYGSEQSFRLHEVLADPFQGAVWSGPPFSTPGWRSATLERNPDSPEWLPRYGDGSAIRFSLQTGGLDIPGATWGPMRIAYLQHASDPVTFFSPDILWRKPDWMKAPVGPDVSPELRWYPVVTFLQIGLDMAIGLWVPMGYGHLFGPVQYIDGWREVTQPEGWTDADIARLKAYFVARQDAAGTDG